MVPGPKGLENIESITYHTTCQPNSRRKETKGRMDSHNRLLAVLMSAGRGAQCAVRSAHTKFSRKYEGPQKNPPTSASLKYYIILHYITG